MNNCEDIEKLKAKSKNNILWLLLMFAIIGGGVCEYRRFQAPLDDLVVVYSPGVVDVKEDKLVATDKVVQEKPNLVEEKEVKKEIALIKEKKVEVVKKNNEDKVKEFKAYIEEVNERLTGIDEADLRLDKVIPYKKVEVNKSDANPVKEGKIEIYDDKSKTVVLEDVKVEESKVVKEKKEEDIKEDKKEIVAKSNDVQQVVGEEKEEVEKKVEEIVEQKVEPQNIVSQVMKKKEGVEKELENLSANIVESKEVEVDESVKEVVENLKEEVRKPVELLKEVSKDEVEVIKEVVKEEVQDIKEELVEKVENKTKDVVEVIVFDENKVNEVIVENVNNVIDNNESLEVVDEKPEVIENKAENSGVEVDILQDGTIDMMKNIVNKNS